MKADLIPIFREAFTALAEAPSSNLSNNTPAVPNDARFFQPYRISSSKCLSS